MKNKNTEIIISCFIIVVISIMVWIGFLIIINSFKACPSGEKNVSVRPLVWECKK